MDRNRKKRISKLMSLLLRHQPQKAGIQLNSAGWVSVDALLDGMKKMNCDVNHDQLMTVVQDNDKQRFQLTDSCQEIRATQGHSVPVDLGYLPSDPPEILFHGTPTQFVEDIRRTGLKRQKRHHVHLHQDVRIAIDAGGRRGRPMLLTIQAGEMHEQGIEFFVTPNDVWLTESVPPEFICFATDDQPS